MPGKSMTSTSRLGIFGATGVLLNCDTRKIGNFLAESGQPVEKSRFA